MLMRLARQGAFWSFRTFYYRREPEKSSQPADFAIRHYWPQWQDVPENMLCGLKRWRRVPEDSSPSGKTVGFFARRYECTICRSG